jgi:IS1 family transposase
MNYGPLSGKKVPKNQEYEDEGTWIWISMAPEYRLVLSHTVGERNQKMAREIVAKTAERLASMPLFVTDGLKFYARALLEQFGQWINYPATGKLGRPRKDRLVPDENLKYAQLIKIKQGGRLKEIIKKTVFGKDIEAELISTSLIERLNLTLRQDNNRISRKTIGFSKKIDGLRKQMNLYFTNYNFCRGHRSLKQLNNAGKIEICTPARYFGLTNRNLTLKELLAIPCYKRSTI